MTGVNGTTLPMSYLDSGQGERTDAGGTHYVNDALGINSETTNGQTTYYTRMPGGKLVSQRRADGSIYYYLFDGQGSVVALTDGSGNVAAQYRYDPWGQGVDKSGAAADGNPWRYTGGYLDKTGYYKLGQRYYDPAQGRFTQLDPLGTGYVYASDNPVNRADPSGLDDQDKDGVGEVGDPLATPIDAAKIDYENPPEGYPTVSFKEGHIFDQSKHGFDELDQDAIKGGIAADAYRRWQIGEFNQNTGVIRPIETHFYVNGQNIDIVYEGFVYPDGSGINISSAWRPGFNK